jgi:hypothetical protein
MSTMPIEMRCTGCGQTLRVGDEHAGKKARCPACEAIVQVPLTGSDMPPPAELGGSDAPYRGAKANPFADRAEPEANPYASPYAPIGPRQYGSPHRGGLVLTFGILGIVCCMPLGIAAWVMGASDLSEIRAGRMDPDGESMTRVGMILGIVSVGLAVLGVLANIAMVLGA